MSCGCQITKCRRHPCSPGESYIVLELLSCLWEGSRYICQLHAATQQLQNDNARASIRCQDLGCCGLLCIDFAYQKASQMCHHAAGVHKAEECDWRD